LQATKPKLATANTMKSFFILRFFEFFMKYFTVNTLNGER